MNSKDKRLIGVDVKRFQYEEYASNLSDKKINIKEIIEKYLFKKKIDMNCIMINPNCIGVLFKPLYTSTARQRNCDIKVIYFYKYHHTQLNSDLYSSIGCSCSDEHRWWVRRNCGDNMEGIVYALRMVISFIGCCKM